MTLSMVGIEALPGREDDARRIMIDMGFQPDSDQTVWLASEVANFPQARQLLIERLNLADWDWSESLKVLDLPDHPDA